MLDPFDTDGAWQRALHDTRLGAYEHAAVPVEDAFAPLWDALGDEVDRGTATRRHWLAGRHDGRRAVVRASASWQVHVVEIDPPLCLGMCASKGPADAEPTLEGFPADWVAALFRTEPEAQALGEALSSTSNDTSSPPTFPRARIHGASSTRLYIASSSRSSRRIVVRQGGSGGG
jgi:hypothetical protein